MPETAVWRSRPIFITSTFRDMHAERDYLRTHVFPELEERLRARRCYLEPIDLRWGVETAAVAEEQAKQLQVLKVCLAEVERSRPFLIGLLGDRYGWVPPADRMEAAAREAGFEKPVAGRSITDLEIDYGVLASPAQRRRCFFYFRGTLPYAGMPPALAAQYAEAHNPEPGAQEAARKLAALKQRLRTELPDRVRPYTAEWDAQRATVTGLEAWGHQVLADLWRELEAETAEAAQAAAPTWQAAERFTLEQFIADRARDFIGRGEILREVIYLATNQGTDATQWGVCVVGAPGAGKSALFAELSRRLQGGSALVLAHAAGISPRATQVDSVLRRWVGELAAALDRPDPLTETTAAEDVEQTFHRLLGQVSTGRRVILLLDALNQFEPSVRAQHLTWLPKLWPPNARLLATSLPGTPVEAMSQRPGVQIKDVPPLAEAEAAAIARAVCRRYHRDLPPAALQALLAKRSAGDQPVAGNPLWLAMVVEELNLLDADDFARADRDFTGTPEARLHQLLLYTVAQMPPDVEGLYAWLLDRAEQLFGTAWAQAFVNCIALSRHGWRESDLRALMPMLANQPWDDLQFARLRRTFRAHVVQRGAQGQWDFSHTQLRLAVTHRKLADLDEVKSLHRALADHLLALPREDPLHETETMVHLIDAADRPRAARFYGGDLTGGEAAGATQALAAHLLVATEAEASARLSLPSALLQEPEVTDQQRARLCNRFLFDLHDMLAITGSLTLRFSLITATSETLNRLAAQDPRNAAWQRDLSVSHSKLGDLLRATGDLAGARQAYEAALAIRQRLAAQDPRNAAWQRDLVVSCFKMGQASAQQGDGTAATSYMVRCRDRLRGMRSAGMFLDPPLVQLLSQLEQLPGGSGSG